MLELSSMQQTDVDVCLQLQEASTGFKSILEAQGQNNSCYRQHTCTRPLQVRISGKASGYQQEVTATKHLIC